MKAWRGLAAVRLAVAVCVAVLASSVAASAQPIIQPFHSFQPATEGFAPSSSPLIQASDGNFYGISGMDGPFFGSAIFKMTPAGVVTLVRLFGSRDMAGPNGPLVRAADGNFYATSSAGLFKMTPAGVTTILHGPNGDGGEPLLAPLIQAADSSFYGVTNWGGGAFGKGTAFRITPDGTFTVLHVFSGYPLDASAITAPLAQTSDGNFLGVSPWGGVFDLGTVFRMTPSGAVTVLHAFEGGPAGEHPSGPLLAASDGNFYGTVSGGAYGLGAIYRMTPDGTVALVYSFQGTADGMAIFGGPLVQAADGYIYGTAGRYGQSAGAIFRMTLDGVVTMFATGEQISNLMQAADGNFYGIGSSSGFFYGGLIVRAASSAQAVMVSPKPSTTLNQASVTFNWSGGAGATAYRLDLGTAPGQHDLFGQDLGLATSQAVSGLPLSHKTIYVRLSTQLGGSWQFYDYTYTATTDTKAAMTSPEPVRTTAVYGSTVEFDWAPGSGATEYWLEVGNSLGGSNFYTASAGTGLSAVVSGLPDYDGNIFARLWTKASNGSWSYTDYSYMKFGPRAYLTFPENGSWFPAAASITFQWTSVPGATGYWLDVGTGVGKHDIASIGGGPWTTGAIVSGLPFLGETVWARLWTQFGGKWYYVDYQYFGFQGKATIISPTPKSALPGSSVTFTWWPLPIATAFWLEVGTAQGQHDLFGQNMGLATSQTVNGLPYLDRTIWVRLWSQIGGRWYYDDYAYPVVNHKARMSSPAPGSTLAGASATFNWIPAAGASQYWLEVGTSLGRGNLFEQGVGLATSQIVSSLPSVGGTVYVRLWTLFNGRWLYNDYTYTAFNAKATMSSPAPGSTLGGQSVTFAWIAGTGALSYWLEAGTAIGKSDIFGQSVGLVTSQTVGGLPANGSPVYVRLWTQLNGGWLFNDYTYTAFNARAAMLSPAPGSGFTGQSVTFGWSTGTGASSYWLEVGTALGRSDIFGQSVGLAISQTVNGLPMTGVTIYVRLWTQLSSGWVYNDYQYSAFSAKAVIAAPAPGPVLTQSTVLFQWNAVAGASEYWLDVGTAPGAADLFTRSTGTSTNQSVTGIPTNAAGVYARLWTQFNGVWQYADAAYTVHVIRFDGNDFSGLALGTHSESTFTVTGTAPSSYWALLGEASAYTAFFSMPGVTTIGELTIVPTQPQFHFNSIDIFSAEASVPYEITATGPGGTIFTLTGTLPNPGGGFVHMTNPYASSLIDQLSIKLTNQPPAYISNYVGVDNINVSY